MSVFHHWFANPWLLLFLPTLLPALGVLAILAMRRRRFRLAKLGSMPALNGLLPVRRWPRILSVLCSFLGLTLLVVGSAGPQWGRELQHSPAPGRDLVVLLDLSRSMLAETPSRLSRARAAIDDLSRTLERDPGHRVALVIFAGRPKVVCPLTSDYDHFRFALDQLAAGSAARDLGPGPGILSGTRIGAGLQAAVEAHDDDPRLHGYQDIVMISDGDDPADDEEWREGVRTARAHGIPVHTVGVGDPETASPIPDEEGPLSYAGTIVMTRLKEQPLREIALQTDGTYTPARTLGLPLGELFRERMENQTLRASEDAVTTYRQRYAWALLPALFLLMGSMAIRE